MIQYWVELEFQDSTIPEQDRFKTTQAEFETPATEQEIVEQVANHFMTATNVLHICQWGVYCERCGE